MKNYIKNILIIYICAQVANCCTDQPSCFVNKIFNFQFPQQGVYPISIEQNQSSYSVKAYGDFNDDLASDFIAINGNNQIVLYLWNKQTNFFIAQNPINISVACFIDSIYLYDVNNDGYLDFTVWGQDVNTNYCLIPFYQNQNKNGNAEVLFQQQNGGVLDNSIPPIYLTHRDPQFNGFLVFNSTRLLMRYDIINKQYNLIQWKQLFLSNGTYGSLPFAEPHWNSFLDISGDCLADVILCNQNSEFQFWINQGQQFQLLYTLPYTDLASLSFSDLNYDGSIDMAVFHSSGIANFYLNTNIPRSSEDFCCILCKTLTLDFSNPINFTVPQGLKISQQVVHFGDVNIDGYPDLQIILKNQTSNTQLPYILINQPKTLISFSMLKQVNDIFISNLQGLQVVSASLFDVLQNGILDSYVLVRTTDNSFAMKTFYNNYLYQNSFFLKGYAAIGPTSDRGSFITGASFYWINSVDGNVKISNQAQCIQTAYNALQLPYVLGGLGRANNYVQSFTVANQGNSHSWSPIIPNSQLAIYTLPTTQKDWAITIYVLPTASLLYVIIISTLILTILGAILIVMKYQQYKRRPKIDDLIG